MRQDPQLLTIETHRYSLPAWYGGSGWAGSPTCCLGASGDRRGRAGGASSVLSSAHPCFRSPFPQSYEAIVALDGLDGLDLAKVTQLVRVARASNPGLPATLVVFPIFCTAFNVCHMYIYVMLPSGPLSKYFFEGCLSGFSCTLHTESRLV